MWPQDLLDGHNLTTERGVRNWPILQTNSTDRLREMRMKGEGVKKNENFADVI